MTSALPETNNRPTAAAITATPHFPLLSLLSDFAFGGRASRSATASSIRDISSDVSLNSQFTKDTYRETKMMITENILLGNTGNL